MEPARRDPGRAAALAREGEEARRLGDLDRARERFREAARLDPEAAGHFVGWGAAARALDRFPEALEALERARSLAAKDPRALYELGETLRLLGRTKESHEILDEAFRLDPTKGALAYSLALSLADLGRPAEAVPILKDVLRRAAVPDAEAPVRFLLSRCLEDSGQAGEARAERARFSRIALLEAEVRKAATLVEADPEGASAHLALAAALRRAGRLPEAHESYLACARLDARNARAAGGAALCRALLAPGPEALAEAEAQARGALALGETAEARAALGSIAGRRGDLSASREHLARALSLAAEDPHIEDLAGKAGLSR